MFGIFRRLVSIRQRLLLTLALMASLPVHITIAEEPAVVPECRPEYSLDAAEAFKKMPKKEFFGLCDGRAGADIAAVIMMLDARSPSESWAFFCRGSVIEYIDLVCRGRLNPPR